MQTGDVIDLYGLALDDQIELTAKMINVYLYMLEEGDNYNESKTEEVRRMFLKTLDEKTTV